jgi:hypothetical protein
MAMDGAKVMDVVTAMAMDGFFEMRQQWTGNGDGHHDSDDNEWRVGNAMMMDGSLAVRW